MDLDKIVLYHFMLSNLILDTNQTTLCIICILQDKRDNTRNKSQNGLVGDEQLKLDFDRITRGLSMH